jgi:DNA-directed DNA polymerase III PolC
MYLNCHTGYSFKYGTLPVKTLFEEAMRCGVRKLVLTEINNTASYLDMLRIRDHFLPRENGLGKYDQLAYTLDIAVGIEFRREHRLCFIAIAQNNDGFESINRYLSHLNQQGKLAPLRAPAFENVYIIYPFGAVHPETLLDYEYIGVRHSDLIRFTFDHELHAYLHKFVVWHPVTLLPPEKKGQRTIYRDHNIHRLLRCIAHNTLLSKLPEDTVAQRSEYMLPEKELEAFFDSYPTIIENTKKILASCSITCALGEDKNKQFFSGSLAKDMALLREETAKGYARAYKDEGPTVWNERIEKELNIIARKKFTTYYLIANDLTSYAKRMHYDYVGRGSGANSTVAYCLGITNVDPIELDLYFERFLNEERTSPPDFDIDFSWDNRDAIYAYLFEKYGYDHVCLLGTHVTYQSNSILRELGKVFGLPKEEIDVLVENPTSIHNQDPLKQKIYNYAHAIIERELPANISIHAGGVLITEKPIYAYTATDIPPKGLPVSHFEMHAAEDFGIYKFDILSQRGLGHIKETVKHVKKNKGIDINVYEFKKFKEDEKIKAMMRQSKLMGCFYVESPAMRMLLGKLRCDDYKTLVAASSIIRPGVASSGMMRTYIERFHMKKNKIPYESIHPKMDELMDETYGVMVYQEDVIKVAHHFAGITLTEADVLRRGMSGKYRSREEFQRVKNRFFEECNKKGYDQKVSDRVWYEIESFSGYSFAKGHSASYAVESYQSLFLKAYYPLEFMVGVINNFGGFYKTEFYFHEARMNGGIIAAPCVNESEYLTSIQGNVLYMGFVHLKSLETKVAHALVEERKQRGAYLNLEDFLLRNHIGLEQVRILIRINAFRFTNQNKQQLLWDAIRFFHQRKERPQTTSLLFKSNTTTFSLPITPQSSVEEAYDEIELLGFPLCNPFDLIESNALLPGRSQQLASLLHKRIEITGYLVTTKITYTIKKEIMQFGTFYDIEGNVFDTVHFPQVAKNYPFRGRGFYNLVGKVTEDFGVYAIDVTRMEKIPMKNKRSEKLFQEFHQ